MLWVSNVKLPTVVILATLAVTVVGGLGALVRDAGAGFERWTFDLLPSQMSALNPLMVMCIIPLLNVAVYAPLRKRGIEVRPLQKMTVGMFLAAAAFGVAALQQVAIERAGVGQVHALWQFIQYLIMTTSEVLVSITGLEFAYTQAPRRMKSTIVGFWLLCVTFGNLIVAFLAPLQKTHALSQFFWLFAGLMAGAALIFTLLAHLYKGKTYLQHG
jgi:POT family proton-dependent oligopeptide transporter